MPLDRNGGGTRQRPWLPQSCQSRRFRRHWHREISQVGFLGEWRLRSRADRFAARPCAAGRTRGEACQWSTAVRRARTTNDARGDGRRPSSVQARSTVPRAPGWRDLRRGDRPDSSGRLWTSRTPKSFTEVFIWVVTASAKRAANQRRTRSGCSCGALSDIGSVGRLEGWNDRPSLESYRRRGYRLPVGEGIPRSWQILRARRWSISRAAERRWSAQRRLPRNCGCRPPEGALRGGRAGGARALGASRRDD
jgi:hypothetical protein